MELKYIYCSKLIGINLSGEKSTFIATKSIMLVSCQKKLFSIQLKITIIYYKSNIVQIFATKTAEKSALNICSSIHHHQFDSVKTGELYHGQKVVHANASQYVGCYSKSDATVLIKYLHKLCLCVQQRVYVTNKTSAQRRCLCQLG